MKSLTEASAILWDFDGVLMNSMPVRDLGFERVLAQFPQEQVSRLMDYHRANGGLSRYHKFRYFHEEILGEPITEDEVNHYARRFSDIMLQLLLNKELLIDDSWAFVHKYHQQIPMHIVSGSDGVELNHICKELELSPYFKSIHGSPTPKKQLVADLLAQHPYPLETTFLIGDSINDFEAAEANRIGFVGYNNLRLVGMGKGYVHTFQSLIQSF